MATSIKYPKVPTKIKIGAQDWTIVERLPNDDGMLNDASYGYTLERSNLIVLDAGLPASRKRQVLLHELLHAIYCSETRSGIKPDMEDSKSDEFISIWEHWFISIYENKLLLLIRENKNLLDYLLSEE